MDYLLSIFLHKLSDYYPLFSSIYIYIYIYIYISRDLRISFRSERLNIRTLLNIRILFVSFCLHILLHINVFLHWLCIQFSACVNVEFCTLVRLSVSVEIGAKVCECFECFRFWKWVTTIWHEKDESEIEMTGNETSNLKGDYPLAIGQLFTTFCFSHKSLRKVTVDSRRARLPTALQITQLKTTSPSFPPSFCPFLCLFLSLGFLFVLIIFYHIMIFLYPTCWEKVTPLSLFLDIAFNWLFQKLDCPVGRGCRIHRLHLWRGVRPPRMTVNNLMVRFQQC